MNIYEIEPFAERYTSDLSILKIELLNNQILRVIMIKGSDYDYLKHYNLWRAVNVADIVRWVNFRDVNVSFLIDGDLISGITSLI